MPVTSAAVKRIRFNATELEHLLAGHERYVLGRGGMRASFKGAVLDGADLSGRILDEADFTGTSLAGANLTGASMMRASFYCADLSGANLHKGHLEQADIRGACFRGADLSHAVLDQADLRAAKMMLVGGDGVSVVNHGKENPFGGVDFSNSSLRDTSFGKAKLDGAIFHGALLVRTSFRGAQLANTSFAGAVMMGVNLIELNLPVESYAGCVFDIAPQAREKAPVLAEKVAQHHLYVSSGGKEGAVAALDGEDLRPLAGQFAGRNLAGLSACGAIGIGLDFSGCQLQGAKFDGADLRGADFSAADLSGTSFHAARVIHACFKNARLANLHFRQGKVLGPNFLGSDAEPAQLSEAELEESLATLGVSSGEEVEI